MMVVPSRWEVALVIVVKTGASWFGACIWYTAQILVKLRCFDANDLYQNLP